MGFVSGLDESAPEWASSILELLLLIDEISELVLEVIRLFESACCIAVSVVGAKLMLLS